jgi:hypothetical protein
MALQRSPITVKPITKQKRRRSRRRGLWFERIMALLALANLGLVAFDMSYVPWRDFYLQGLPEWTRMDEFTRWYGQRFKGIEPHRFTEAYLDTVLQLEEAVAQGGLQSPEAEALLQELQTLSQDMIDEDPFQVANKSGTLERIKNRMRDLVDTESSKDAFTTFWSQEYLLANDWTDSITFFNEDIRPLMETNYWRSIGIDGNPTDLFWQIDIWFIAVFGLEFLARTIYISRRYQGTNWLDAILWRWYDIFLLLPFWRWLRVIPVTVRLHQSQLVDMEPIITRVTRGILASVAVEMTEIVVLRVIEQVQNLTRQGEISRWLLQPESGRRYIDINDVNEMEVISRRLATILVYQVLPKVKPDVDALLYHSINQALNSSAVYRNFPTLPGMGDLTDRLLHQVASEVSRNTYGIITATLEDKAGAELTQKLIATLLTTMQSEVQQEDTVAELERLINTLLEEVKINYVQQLAGEDVENLRKQTEQLYEITQRAR